MLRLLGFHASPPVRMLLAAGLLAVGIGAHLLVLAVAGGVVLVLSAAQAVAGFRRRDDARDDRTGTRPR